MSDTTSFKTKIKKPCICGKTKPYRRARNCKDCWGKVTNIENVVILRNSGRTNGDGSLSLRGNVNRAKKGQN